MQHFFRKVFLAAVIFGISNKASAQYPDIPKADQRASDSLLKAANRHSDSAWAIAFPIIKKQAKEGKPYVPWASRPDELPQSEIRELRAVVNLVLVDGAVK
jgi:hypothetical protein